MYMKYNESQQLRFYRHHAMADNNIFQQATTLQLKEKSQNTADFLLILYLKVCLHCCVQYITVNKPLEISLTQRKCNYSVNNEQNTSSLNHLFMDYL